MDFLHCVDDSTLKAGSIFTAENRNNGREVELLKHILYYPLRSNQKHTTLRVAEQVMSDHHETNGNTIEEGHAFKIKN